MAPRAQAGGRRHRNGSRSYRKQADRFSRFSGIRLFSGRTGRARDQIRRRLASQIPQPARHKREYIRGTVMNDPFLFDVRNGLATLGPSLVRIRDLLEARFLAWADESGADRMIFAPLMRIEDLDSLDYFRNFPHLALIVSPIRSDCLTGEYAKGDSTRSIPSEHLSSSQYALPSAACYSIYLHLKGSVIDEPRYVTTVASCFRNEKEYTALSRRWRSRRRISIATSSANGATSEPRTNRRPFPAARPSESSDGCTRCLPISNKTPPQSNARSQAEKACPSRLSRHLTFRSLLVPRSFLSW